MSEETPQAAGKDGQTNQAVFSDQPAPPRTDDELRRYAAEQLAEHLTIGVDLAARCQNLSLRAESDKVGPINAAARLMQANARIAEALATFAQIERRRRTITERIQPPDKKKDELNSTFDPIKRAQANLRKAETGEKLYRRINDMCNETIRARMGDPASRDIVAEKIKEAKWDYEKAQETLTQLGAQ